MSFNRIKKVSVVSATATIIAACNTLTPHTDSRENVFYGTLEPFAEESIYFLLTDRFVDGDPTNNYPNQGGNYPSFNQPLTHQSGEQAYLGYLGGDYFGILKNADYIADLGFTSIWLSPIVNNPDAAFSGGAKFGEAIFADHNKSGYHGYWGVNFFEEDEHWVSDNLHFAELTHQLKTQYNVKVVLDIVANHGSPSYTLKEDQPLFGEIYDKQGNLVADHSNLHPESLDPSNQLHKFFHTEPDIAELSNLDDTNPAVLDYFVDAYLMWIKQGAAAFRIDTIRHMPHAFWQKFSERVRTQHPNFFMFGESFDWRAEKIAEHTAPANGAISVLDFPGREKMQAVFEQGEPLSVLQDYLYLDNAPYHNAYELVTFYDNHDMSRLNATDENFINVNNWLFTARGIPAIYYGSEIGFMRGTKEYFGNRNYFGQARVDTAMNSAIAKNLKRIANIRKNHVSLQKGIQFNITFKENTAAFLRIYQYRGEYETALVLLNTDSQHQLIETEAYLDVGEWYDATTNEHITLTAHKNTFELAPNSVRVLFRHHPIENTALLEEICTRPNSQC